MIRIICSSLVATTCLNAGCATHSAGVTDEVANLDPPFAISGDLSREEAISIATCLERDGIPRRSIREVEGLGSTPPSWAGPTAMKAGTRFLQVEVRAPNSDRADTILMAFREGAWSQVQPQSDAAQPCVAVGPGPRGRSEPDR